MRKKQVAFYADKRKHAQLKALSKRTQVHPMQAYLREGLVAVLRRHGAL